MARRTRVLLDVDEVIADFVGYYLKVAGRKMFQEYNHSQVTQWCIPEALRLPDWAKREVDYELRRPGTALKLEVLPDAKDAVIAMSEIADIVFVTSPYVGSQTWANDRYEWLRHHFGDLAEHTVFARHKAPIVGEVFVDDRPENLKSWIAENTGAAIVWDKPHNQEFDHPLVKRMNQWEDVIRTVLQKSATR